MEEREPFWKILEFYSGIGGMRYSLLKSGVKWKVVEAFDINDVANDVYEYNFIHRPYQGNIQNLTAEDLDGYHSHAWLLSPPCQPYTRQGLQKHSADARAFSFLNILDLIQVMQHPPMFLFVENVVGFEISDTHEMMLNILARTGFIVQEFILSPLQFGIPYSRPRYFCLAKRKPLFFKSPSYNGMLTLTPSPLLTAEEGALLHPYVPTDEKEETINKFCEPIRNFLEPDLPCQNVEYCINQEFILPSLGHEGYINCSATEDHASEQSQSDFVATYKSGEGLCRADGGGGMDNYFVPLSLIERWGSAMDIVFPDSKRCCCFTKSYYRYVKGTGSLLATSKGNTGGFDKKGSEVSCLKELGLRYFTPGEVANLHSFPEDFQFPPHVSLRQRYALLGNSLSVAVVAPLLRYLFAEPL